MAKVTTIHLDEPNTLAKHLSQVEREHVTSLKVTGLMGREDFEDVLEDLCLETHTVLQRVPLSSRRQSCSMVSAMFLL